MTNRRIYQRFVVNNDSSLIEGDGIEKSILLKNFSSGGASIIMDRFLNESERVKLVIDAPCVLDKPVTRDAEMVWCKKINNNSWRLGLDFGLNKVVIPYPFPKEEGEKKPPSKKFKIKIFASVILIAAIIGGFVFFMLKGTLEISPFLRKFNLPSAQKNPSIFTRSRIATLRGISFDPRGASFALINNRTVEAGDQIEDGVEVKKINRDSIELTIRGSTRILELNKSIVIRPE